MVASKYAVILCVILLVGCGSLPRPHKISHANPAVRVNGAHGTLSVGESKTVLAKLETGSPETNIFSRHLAQVEEISGPLATGNKVTLLLDGPSTYKSMYAAIQGAKNNINMETYSIEDDEVGRRFAAALIEKKKKACR